MRTSRAGTRNSNYSQTVRDLLETIEETVKQENRPNAVLVVRTKGMRDNQGFIIPEDEAKDFIYLLGAGIKSAKSLYPDTPLVVLTAKRSSNVNTVVLESTGGWIVKKMNLVDVLKKDKNVADVIDVKKLNKYYFVDLFNLDTDNWEFKKGQGAYGRN